MGVHIQMTPAGEGGGERSAIRGGGRPSKFCAYSLPPRLFLTLALKGSFLVMSSSSEDKESISRSILLTFSLG